MDLNNIYELWDRFDASDVVEMELEMQGVRFSLKTAQAARSTATSEIGEQAVAGGKGKKADMPAKSPSVENAVENTLVNTDNTVKKPVEAMGRKEAIEVKAPLLGTFYQAPSPDAQPFVKVGQEIHKGDVIGIIEAMKLMNDVVATADGVVQEILVEDGMMVEYDQVLITIA